MAFVGTGAISNAYSLAIEGFPKLRVCAVVDVDAGRRGAAAARHGVEGFASVDELLATAHADAAVVMTPPSTHAELATKLLDRGVHVLCEKPFAIDVASAERMAESALRNDRTLMMASKFRYVADVDKAQELLEQGVIGDVLLFENAFCSRVDMTRRWNSDRDVAGGGVLIDNGSHSVDIARCLCGPLARIQAQFGRRIQPIEVEDTARILFESESGTMGAIDLSWSLQKDVTSFVRMYGTRGTLEIGWRRSRYKQEGDADWTAFGSGYDKVSAFRNQLEEFAATVLGTARPRITLEDAVWSVRALEAAYRSASVNKWVSIGP